MQRGVTWGGACTGEGGSPAGRAPWGRKQILHQEGTRGEGACVGGEGTWGNFAPGQRGALTWGKVFRPRSGVPAWEGGGGVPSVSWSPAPSSWRGGRSYTRVLGRTRWGGWTRSRVAAEVAGEVDWPELPPPPPTRSQQSPLSQSQRGRGCCGRSGCPPARPQESGGVQRLRIPLPGPAQRSPLHGITDPGPGEGSRSGGGTKCWEGAVLGGHRSSSGKRKTA